MTTTPQNDLDRQIQNAKNRLARLRSVDTYGIDHKVKIDKACQRLAVLLLERGA